MVVIVFFRCSFFEHFQFGISIRVFFWFVFPLSIFFHLFYSTSSAYPLLEKSYVEYVRKISKKKSELTQPRTDHDDLHCDASLVPSVRSDLANVAMYDYLLCNKAILAIFTDSFTRTLLLVHIRHAIAALNI